MARLKQVPIRIGDSLQGIAHRELGDAMLWRNLVEMNRLKPPYLINSIEESERQPGTLIWGDTIAVPLSAVNDSAVLGEDALGTDVGLYYGHLGFVNGDLATESGNTNFAQALRHRLATPSKSYIPHPAYGCEIHALLGLGNGPTLALIGAAMAKRAIMRDPRATRTGIAGSVDGDKLLIKADVEPTPKDTIIDFNAVFQIPRM